MTKNIFDYRSCPKRHFIKYYSQLIKLKKIEIIWLIQISFYILDYEKYKKESEEDIYV